MCHPNDERMVGTMAPRLPLSISTHPPSPMIHATSPFAYPSRFLFVSVLISISHSSPSFFFPFVSVSLAVGRAKSSVVALRLRYQSIMEESDDSPPFV